MKPWASALAVASVLIAMLTIGAPVPALTARYLDWCWGGIGSGMNCSAAPAAFEGYLKIAAVYTELSFAILVGIFWVPIAVVVWIVGLVTLPIIALSVVSDWRRR